jgi:hypothetical protein
MNGNLPISLTSNHNIFPTWAFVILLRLYAGTCNKAMLFSKRVVISLDDRIIDIKISQDLCMYSIPRRKPQSEMSDILIDFKKSEIEVFPS